MTERRAAAMIMHGALVFLIGMAVGFPYAFHELGRIELWPFPGSITVELPGDTRAWRMAHLEGILNGLTLMVVAAVAPRLSLTERVGRLVAWGLIVTAWGNVVASVLGPIAGGRGLAFGGGVANSIMYLLFVAAIVAVMLAMALVFAAARTAAAEPERR